MSNASVDRKKNSISVSCCQCCELWLSPAVGSCSSCSSCLHVTCWGEPLLCHKHTPPLLRAPSYSQALQLCPGKGSRRSFCFFLSSSVARLSLCMRVGRILENAKFLVISKSQAMCVSHKFWPETSVLSCRLGF